MNIETLLKRKEPILDKLLIFNISGSWQKPYMNPFFYIQQPGGHVYCFKLNFNIWKLHAAIDMFV